MPPPPRPQSEKFVKSNSSADGQSTVESKPPSMARAHSDGGAPFAQRRASDESSDSDGEIQAVSPDEEVAEGDGE
jgi:hypothetical protein